MKVQKTNDGAVFDKSRQSDSSGALADTNENREVAPDNFYNTENVKANEIKNEIKKTYEKSSKIKKARLRAIEANNKLYARKQRNKLKRVHRSR